MPFFSVITVCYNPDNSFERTAESLKNQTCKDFEWIVIDGFSNNSSQAIIKKYDQFINFYLSEPDNGISDAFNKGLSNVSGEYVLILNVGDTYDENFLNYIKPFCISNNLISCGARVEDEFSSFTLLPSISRVHTGMFLPHNWLAVPKCIYDEIGNYKLIEFSMDYDWLKRYLNVYGISEIIIINKAFGNYTLGGVSDKDFLFSFWQNYKINRCFGFSKLYSFYIFSLSIFKHFLFKIIRSFKK